MALYSFGSNGNGQLGLGHTEDTDAPGLVLFEDEEGNAQFTGISTASGKGDGQANVDLAFGGNHTLLLDKHTGRVYGCGDNTHSQLGRPAGGSTTKFTALDIPAPVQCVAAGWQFSVAVTRDGGLYTAGSGGKGELASDVKQHAAFVKVFQFDVPGVRAHAGLAHACVVLESGEVWGWGVCRNGQLGVRPPGSSARSVWTPTRVVYESMSAPGGAAVDVACGRAFTAVLKQDGSVEVLSTDATMLGAGERLRLALRESGDPVQSTSTGWSTVHVLTQSGRLLSFGRDSLGQLGPEGGIGRPLSQHSSGTEHSLGVTQDGLTVVAWGWGEHGNCGPMGNGDINNAEGRPKGEVLEVHKGQPGRPVRQIWGGYATSWILEQE